MLITMKRLKFPSIASDEVCNKCNEFSACLVFGLYTHYQRFIFIPGGQIFICGILLNLHPVAISLPLALVSCRYQTSTSLHHSMKPALHSPCLKYIDSFSASHYCMCLACLPVRCQWYSIASVNLYRFNYTHTPQITRKGMQANFVECFVIYPAKLLQLSFTLW